MAVLKILPSTHTAIWGGRKLIEEYHKNYSGSNLSETWELSVHPDGPSIIGSGEDAGLSLPEYIKKHGESILGLNCKRFDDFPILIKFIDACGDLSVQVHPDDAYALKHEGQYGKTEMWYVIEAEEGARLCYGCKRKLTKEEFLDHVNANTLDQVLNMVPVKKGDIFFIEAGTIHAIGSGILLAEIQQNSNVTYRLYDYGRLGADGKPRSLHITQGLDVAKLEPPRTDYDFGDHIGMSSCFTVDLLTIAADVFLGEASEDSFVSLLVTEGSGTVSDLSDSVSVSKGDSLFIPAGTGTYRLSGDMTVIRTMIPASFT